MSSDSYKGLKNICIEWLIPSGIKTIVNQLRAPRRLQYYEIKYITYTIKPGISGFCSVYCIYIYYVTMYTLRTI